MLQCPQCTKPLRELARRCPSCQANLDLLVDYVSHLQGGLERAENLVRAGELGPAVWAYLEVLEVDPDNATAKKQVGQVVTAVRQFDGFSPGRRFHGRVRSDSAFTLERWHWWALGGAVAVLFLCTFVIGFLAGTSYEGSGTDENGPPVEKPPNNTLGG